MKLARLALLLVSVTTLACGDDSNETAFNQQPPADGGADAVGNTDAAQGTCDPVAQNCPSGQQCVGGCNVAGVMAQLFTCAVPSPGATGTNGQDCGVGCAPGHDCYTVGDGDGGTRSVCRKYCNTNADCPNNACVDEGLICSAGQVPIGRLCAL
jgi:hypothetical protein